MDIFESLLGNISGGRVLDIATLEGRFVQILMENLKDYHEIVGIDINGPAIENAREALGQEDITFLVMNAEHLDFEDESFDTVCISASLHHLENIEHVLGEMKRVLKSGGHFILAEMHRDAHTEAEFTTIYLHQWAAEVDSALGRLHNHTLARQDLVDHIMRLGLSRVEYHDLIDSDSIPNDDDRLEQLEGVIDRIQKRAEAASNFRELKEQGETLRRRLHEVGALSEPVLIAIGEK
jgi:ubiquinone/menaquinone biosynthesis C-methylase UbiE